MCEHGGCLLDAVVVLTGTCSDRSGRAASVVSVPQMPHSASPEPTLRGIAIGDPKIQIGDATALPIQLRCAPYRPIRPVSCTCTSHAPLPNFPSPQRHTEHSLHTSQRTSLPTYRQSRWE